jgi:hypothetical protein
MLLAVLPICSFAQQGAHELLLSRGVVSGTQIDAGLSAETRTNVFHTYYDKQTSNTGNLFVTYRYGFSRIFSIGATAGIQRYTADRFYDNSSQFLLKTGSHTTTVVSYAAELKVNYVTSDLYQLYGFAGLGSRRYTVSRELVNEPSAGQPMAEYDRVFQVTPLGIRVGKTFNGFMEIGYGYKGLGNLGIGYKMGGHKKKVVVEQPM